MPHAPHLPGFVTAAARVLPVPPLAFLLSRLAGSIAKDRPGFFERLGEHAEKTIAVTPADLDLVFLIKLHPARPSVDIVRPHEYWRSDARIAGTLFALANLAEGRADADALFFSREITIEGDMEAVLALRNALDAEGIDLAAEICKPLGPLAGSVSRLGRSVYQAVYGRMAARSQERIA